MKKREKKDRYAKTLIWAGRTIGTIWSLWFLFIVVGEAIYATEPVTIEGIALALLFSICMVGIVISYFRVDIGGVVAGLGGIAFMIFGFFSAGHNQWIAVLVSGFPFFLSGGFLLLAWWKMGGFAYKKKKK